MFFNLFKKEPKKDNILNHVYTKIKTLYKYTNVSDEKKEYLKEQIEKYGYLPIAYIKALKELTPAEILYGLELKWEKEGTFKNGSFIFANNEVSPLARYCIKNSNWIKREQHNIKLINLAGLGNGNETQETGKFIDWLRQLLILPAGKKEFNVLNTTIYLIPFHPREFGCAYLPTGYGVSRNLEDKELKDQTGLEAREQVILFIQLAQLAGHPVIYDVLPQTGRFSKLVLSNPSIVRWFDIKALLSAIEEEIDKIAVKFKEKYDEDDVDIIVTVIKNTLHSGSGELSEFYKEIYEKFSQELLEKKKELSNKMSLKSEQAELSKRVKKIVAQTHNYSEKLILREKDITKQGETTQVLIKEGMWSIPGGAWCSSGMPVFDRMSECGGFPVFKHFNHKEEDVTGFANLDCQAPFYFVHLENGDYNWSVITFFVNFLKKLQQKYNFDGFRVDHIDHVIDEISQKDGVPISYRAPQKVLEKLNHNMKEKVPYFSVMAEYMLFDKLYKQYHRDMKFDILWGDDIVCQSDKTPAKIVEDNQELARYNMEHDFEPLSVVKTYNNQDGEFEAIDRYPGQLGEKGALFKWFKYKFLPGGKNAQRPAMYVDGDESFTKTGIEGVIGAEVSMPRGENLEFFAKFDAINRFALENPLTRDGEAEIIIEEEDGFVAWLISKDLTRDSLLVVANYMNETEKIRQEDENGASQIVIKEGEPLFDKVLELPCDYKITAEVKLPEKDGLEMIEEKFKGKENNKLTFKKLDPNEFHIYKLIK